MKVPGPSPLPLVGNLLETFKNGITSYDEKLMQKYGRIVGYYEGSTPNLLITDVKLIKAITIKDFEHFINHRVKLIPKLIKFLFKFSILNWQ
jgi:hypothetical protein